MDPRNLVKSAYDSIGSDFGKKRTITWGFVLDWLNEKKSKSNNNLKLLIAGCGNGRHVRLATELGFDVKAIDISEKMVNATKVEEKKYGRTGENIIISDVCDLPFIDEEFDLIICIAVLHHLPFDLCEVALNEFSRVLKNKGELLISCWDRSSPSLTSGNFDQKYDDVMWVNWTLPNDKIISRYYHLPLINDRKLKWDEINKLKCNHFELLNFNQLFYFSKI